MSPVQKAEEKGVGERKAPTSHGGGFAVANECCDQRALFSVGGSALARGVSYIKNKQGERLLSTG